MEWYKVEAKQNNELKGTIFVAGNNHEQAYEKAVEQFEDQYNLVDFTVSVEKQ